MSSVGEMSQALEGALEAAGRMEQDDAKQWLVDNYSGEDEEVQPKEIGLVLGYGTELDGLSFVPYLQMPGKPYDGDWTLGVYLDQRANPEQAEALGTILSGQAGGMFAALGGANWHGPSAKAGSHQFRHGGR